MRYNIILYMILFVIILTGCTRVVYVDRYNTIYSNETLVINNTVPCPINNVTINASATTNIITTTINNCSYSNRSIDLILRIKQMEKQQDKYWNNSECFDDLNKTEVKLDECELELCEEWNSSWCY